MAPKQSLGVIGPTHKRLPEGILERSEEIRSVLPRRAARVERSLFVAPKSLGVRALTCTMCVQDIQEGHKEGQGVLLRRIISLEGSLRVAQESYGELAKMRERLVEKEIECQDLQVRHCFRTVHCFGWSVLPSSLCVSSQSSREAAQVCARVCRRVG